MLSGILPRPTGPCRSETYKHYATCHFASELRAKYGPVGAGRMVACGECGKAISRSSRLAHTGQVHGRVEDYLPERAKLAVVPRKRTAS